MTEKKGMKQLLVQCQNALYGTMVASLLYYCKFTKSLKIQPKLYEPTMTGSKYSHAITQLETHGVLHPVSHMFVQEDFYQSDPDVMAHIMRQLSLKSGLKQWGNKAYVAVTLEMKQLHFRSMFQPKHWSRLSKTQHQTVLESHMWMEETNSETTFPRKMQVCQPSPQKPYYYCASSMLRKEGMLL
jgi:hypothetical protein